MPKMKWIGLTGGIATGKSTVARLIESRKYSVIDADLISHEMTRLGEPGYLQILSHFGSEILQSNQQLDRSKLGEIVFKNHAKKSELEKILHPLIQNRVKELRQEFEADGHRYCFYDVPLLFEKNLQSQFYLIMTSWCPPALQLARLKSRNKLTTEQATERISSQFSMFEKIGNSHVCIDNSGSESDLILLVNKFCDQLDLNAI